MLRLAVILCLVFSQALAAQSYGFLTWSVEEGLPQSQVTALAQDARGYLWVGTHGGGVARFDGRDFETFDVADGLADNFVRGLAADPAGTVYALTRRGLALLHPDSTKFLPVSLSGSSLLQEGAGAGAAGWGQMQWMGEGRLRHTSERTVYNFAASDEGWSVSTEPGPRGVTGPNQKLPGGNQLHGTRGRGLFLLTATGEPIKRYTEDSGDLPHNTILALLQDRQGRTWAGTSGGGLVRVIPTGLRYFDTRNGLAAKRIYAVHAGKRDGKIWLGTGNEGVRYYQGGNFGELPTDDPTRGVKIGTITQDGAGRTYFGTDGNGLAFLDSNRVRRITQRDGLPSDYLLRLLPAGDSSIHVVSYAKGIAPLRYFPTRDSFAVGRYPATNSLPTLSLASAIQAPDSTLLLGTTDGRIQRLPYGQLGKVVVYDEENGLPPGRVSALSLRLGTQLWAAVEGYGLYYTDLRSSPVRFFPLPARFRDLSANIFQLTLDPARPALWLGTERGVSRLFLNQDGQPDYLQHYGRAEGFLGGETTRGATTVDSLGRLWFGTLNGLVRYEDDRSDLYLAPPPTFLERINLFYEPVVSEDYEKVDDVPTFRAADNHFQFRYGAVDLTYADRLQFRFRLRGEDPEWSPLTDERSVRYAGLTPGRYTFLVQATTDGGKTFGDTAQYIFAIKAPLLRAGWFLGLVTLLLATSIITVTYLYFQRVQRREALLREELETQNRLLNLEQKARQLQMNPHFIFNALNGIRGLVAGENGSEARRQITRFASLMRGILNNSREDTITLADEVKVLREYIEMERFCQNFPIEYAIDLPEGADPEEVSLPPMLLQPFVENAILHGLAGKEEGGKITVRFRLRGRGMLCTVEDDGIGREAAAERRANRNTAHRSVAVEVTRQRLEAAGGSLTIKDRPTGGTVVEITVPVEVW